MSVATPPSFRACGIETSQGDLNTLASLAEVACRGKAYPLLIEVGSWAGRTALALLQGANRPGLKLLCIDTWMGSPGDVTSSLARSMGPEKVLGSFLENVSPHLFDTIVPLVGPSALWGRLLPPDRKADLIFLDADHDYEAIRDDIRLWTPRVKKGGILCGHDFGSGFPGVEKAVQESGPYELAGDFLWVRRL